MEQRADFVREYQSGLFTMTELAAHYGISRKTGYKWVTVYEADGLAGLQDRARRPHHSPHAIDEETVALLLAIRRRHPRWGPKKLLTVAARRHRGVAWPARSTLAAVLTRRGLVTPRRRRGAPSVPTAAAHGVITGPNEVWTVDYKGEFLTGDRRYCYPLTLRDGFSRYVLRCDALTAHTRAVTRPRLERAFAEYGLPDRIRSDTGPPFGGPGLGRLSTLAVWWIRLGILPERSIRAIPSRTARMSSFIACSKRRRPGPRRRVRARNSVASPASAPNTTTSGPTKVCSRRCRRSTIGPRRAPCRAGSRPSSIPGM